MNLKVSLIFLHNFLMWNDFTASGSLVNRNTMNIHPPACWFFHKLGFVGSYFPEDWKIGKLHPLGSQTRWLIIGGRCWFAAWCLQTTCGGYKMPKRQGCCTFSRPGISGTPWPSMGRTLSQTHTQTQCVCATFLRAAQPISDRGERQLSGGKPHARRLETVTRCHNETQEFVWFGIKWRWMWSTAVILISGIAAQNPHGWILTVHRSRLLLPKRSKPC